MRKPPVIYEVTLDVNAAVIAEFDAWLKQHMRQMRALPGFRDARLLPAEAAAVQGVAPEVRRVVQYRLADRKAFDHYLDQYAARMRADGVQRFGDQIRSRRRLLDDKGAELPLPEPAGAEQGLRCLNCHALLTGKFCAACGQPNHTYAAPLWADIQEFFGNHFGFDTKFFRSIGPLLFRPGFLSREYSAGRRIRYINPLRLYIFSSLLFFFIAWALVPPQITAPGSASTRRTTAQIQRQEIQNLPYLTSQQKQLILKNAVNGTADNSASAPQDDSGVVPIFGQSFSVNKSDFKARFMHAFESNLPKLLFVFLPLVALLLKLFYLRSRRYYMEHLVFTLHNHAFIFVAMAAILLMQLLAKHAVWLSAPAEYFKNLVGWYIVVYVFLAMLFYYRQSFFKTLGKYLLIGCIYWITLLTTFVLGVLLFVYEAAAA